MTERERDDAVDPEEIEPAEPEQVGAEKGRRGHQDDTTNPPSDQSDDTGSRDPEAFATLEEFELMHFADAL